MTVAGSPPTRVAVTGTPGTGKTTAVERLPAVAADSRAAGLEPIHLNRLVREGAATDRDDERGSLVADMEALADRLAGREGILVESHLAHRLDADLVAVLRCHPHELTRRLRDRGEPEATVVEDARAEALDVVLAEAVDRYGRDRVYELDTTDRPPDAVARWIAAVVAGERDPDAGTVDFSDVLPLGPGPGPGPDSGAPGAAPDTNTDEEEGDGTAPGGSEGR